MYTQGRYNTVNQFGQDIIPKIIKVDASQLTCMAKNIFYEAGGETLLGQAAVARVVLNRVYHGFAKTPCAVIHQSTVIEKVTINGSVEQVKMCQFSWVCEEKVDPSKNNPNYIQAKQVAYDVLVNDRYKEVVPRSTLFFHNMQVVPRWSYRQVAKIGNHIFYSNKKKESTQKI
jgi:spore germination cell wall hydrolase CwlJ-like protein